MESRATLLDTTSEKNYSYKTLQWERLVGDRMKGTGNAFYAWLLSDAELVSTPVISKSDLNT
ncbi:MAG: hypothetical protein IPN15_16260 [Saprospiraceae bacterium]|nr:hypothetical protein [Candidatus Vicinibacter affinis]